MSDTPPSKKQLIQYSFLALPLAFAGLPLYIHAPDFYTRSLGMDLGLIGLILLCVRLIDALQDPILGYLSDRYAMQRYAVLSIGTVILILGMAAVFYGPIAPIATSVWFAIALVCATTGFSLVVINLNMIGGFWLNSPTQRTHIAAWRESFSLMGLLIASITPTALQQVQTIPQSFISLFWVFAGMILLGFSLFHVFMHTLPKTHAIYQAHTQTKIAFIAILQGPNKAFFSLCFLTQLAGAIPSVLVLFFINDYLKLSEFSGLFLALYFIAGAACMVLWVKLSGYYGKKKTWCLAQCLAVCTFIGAYTLSRGDAWLYGVICILSGCALGADLTLPPSILADKISHQKKISEATQYYALLALLPKFALAIASGCAFLMLDTLGFSAGRENSPTALAGLVLLYTLIPCALKLSAGIGIWFLYKTEGEYSDNTLHKDVNDGT